MPDSPLRYDRMVEEALRGVVVKALAHVAENGLPGGHHFYITFRTDRPGVVLPDYLRSRFPAEMTIVLQYQFWGLDVGPDAFAVTLSFADVPERLTIPYAAIAGFADPSVRFGLQFDLEGGKLAGQGAEPPTPSEPPRTEAPRPAAPAALPQAEVAQDRATEAPADKVVTLDAFRRK